MISREEILNLAELARLELSEAEVASLEKDISNILEYVGQVAKVSAEAKGEVPLVRNVLRADTERGEGDPLSGKRESLLEALPKREGDYNVVRKIIQKDE
jgi:aspartyl-tRNA(Asn)/glutamyl-tRNA(Gln) amidotransferase subunit C